MDKKNKRPNIKILAVGKNNIYYVGEIKISPRGDVFYCNKILVNGEDQGIHFSRHTDGTRHTKISKEPNFKQKSFKGKPINKFEGIEHFSTIAFGLDSLEILHGLYDVKDDSKGIFTVDMREYGEGGAFNMSVGIFTEEGLPKVFEAFKGLGKRQIYTYMEGHPWIFIAVCDASKK